VIGSARGEWGQRERAGEARSEYAPTDAAQTAGHEARLHLSNLQFILLSCSLVISAPSFAPLPIIGGPVVQWSNQMGSNLSLNPPD
jgi:hypothetical protein